MRHGDWLALYETRVAPDWVDYNGHMNDAAYALVFSLATDALMDRVGLDAAARKATGQTLYTLQMMLHYFREALEGAPLHVFCQLIEHDDKRMRVWLEMRDGAGIELAASEQLLLSVAKADDGPRAVPWRAETMAALDALRRAQAGMLRPPQAGLGVILQRDA